MSVTTGRTGPVRVFDGRQSLSAMRRDTWIDLREGFRLRELWLFLGWRDVRKHYSRSILGPFWLTLSMGLLVGGLGILYSQIFNQPIHDYLPFLAIGFIAWGLISGLIVGSCNVYSAAAASIRQVRMPLSVYVYQFVWQQLITFAHNFVIYVAVALFFGIWPGLTGLLVVPALLLVSLNGIFAAMVLGPLCARFRDIPMIVASAIQVAFFMSPILWSPEMVPQRAFFVQANPFYHLIEILRDPLLGSPATLTNWLVCILGTAMFGVVAFLFFSRFRQRVPYWA